MAINERTVFRAGVRDWLIQRASALVMLAYIATMVVWWATHQPVSYESWVALFHCPAMKVMTVVTMIFLCLHAWVGVWTVVTDYVGAFVLRMVLFLLIILALLAYLIWTIQIVWGV